MSDFVHPNPDGKVWVDSIYAYADVATVKQWVVYGTAWLHVNGETDPIGPFRTEMTAHEWAFNNVGDDAVWTVEVRWSKTETPPSEKIQLPDSEGVR